MKLLFDFIFGNLELRKLKVQLQDTLLFQDLTQRELQRVMQKVSVRSFSKGQHVFFQGDPGSALYIILKGSVRIVLHSDARPVSFTTLSTGMFFGEIALVDAAPRSASAVIEEDSVLAILFKHDIEQLTRYHPKLGVKLLWNLSNILGQRLRAMNKRLDK